VWEDNSLAQKNLTIVDLKPDQWIVMPFVVGNLQLAIAKRYQLELRRPGKSANVEAQLLHPTGRPFDHSGLTSSRPSVPAAVRHDRAMSDDGTGLDCGASHMVPGDASGSARDVGDVLRSGSAINLRLAAFSRAASVPFPAGETTSIELLLRAREQIVPAVRLHVPATAKAGDVLRLDLLQRDAKSKVVIGGVSVQIRVR
jgi:hypothetical protein